jgi:hypothetical protein
VDLEKYTLEELLTVSSCHYCKKIISGTSQYNYNNYTTKECRVYCFPCWKKYIGTGPRRGFRRVRSV